MPKRIEIQLSKALTFDLMSPQISGDGYRVYIGGESGCGKSHVAASIFGQALEQGVQCVLLDAHGEYGPLAALAKRATLVGYDTKRSLPLDKTLLPEYEDRLVRGESLFFNLKEWTDLRPRLLNEFMGGFEASRRSAGPGAVVTLRKALDKGDDDELREAAEKLCAALERNDGEPGLLARIYGVARRNPKPRMVLYEEAQNFAPQSKATFDNEKTRVMVGIMTGGRKYGLHSVVCTQRQALVDKSVLSACNVRIIMRTSDFADWKRLEEYIPEKLDVTFDEHGTGIRRFASGEAVVLSRWLADTRTHLSLPAVSPKNELPGVLV